MLPAPPERCLACDLPPVGRYTLRNGALLLQCPACGLAWWQWPSFDPVAFYDEDYFQCATAERGYNDYAALEVGVRRTARVRLRRIMRLTTGRRLFEFGAGTGVFLDEARRHGWNVAGAEISTYAAGKARARDLEVANASAEDLRLEPAAYDCVCLWDVVEHLPTPHHTLAIAARALRPGGVLALSTGDITSLCARWSGANWHLFNLPEHLFFFSPRALTHLLTGAGCRTVHITREVNWVPVRYVVERLRKRGGPFNSLLRFAVQPLLWFGEQHVVPATLFDVLGVYAVREDRDTGSG
ncbi:MAG: class I SAM-dependent methyltransferase [Phycisphaerales bacterium]|nr:class I SAM-dependent methyltransferase [Phycisphaerales bacterium]